MTMTDQKAARLAAIRAANAARQQAEAPSVPEPSPTPAVPVVSAPTSAARPANDEKAARLAAIRATNAARQQAEASPATDPTVPIVSAAARPSAPARPAARAAELDDQLEAMAPGTLVALLLAAVVGALSAAVVLPRWLPGLSASLLGESPKAFWYLSRSSAMVSYGLVWLSMVFGLSITGKMARAWPGGPTMFDLHQHASLLGLAFAIFHALILLGDRFIDYTLAQVLVPFASSGYEPLAVGLGQVALYLLALVSLSFYVRRRIGHRTWRLLHFLSFALFALALAHGIMAGSESGSAWARGLYWGSGASVLFLTVYRALVSLAPKRA